MPRALHRVADQRAAGERPALAEQPLGASHFTAIGAFSRAVVDFDEQVEVLSLAGDITIEDGRPKLHAHAVLGTADATAHGGHLVEASVRPTLEIVVTELPRHLRRRFDPASGPALIDRTV